MSDFFSSLEEASQYARVCRQAIYLAIKKGRLKATKKKTGNVTHWVILKKDLDEYRSTKYDRDNDRRDGERVIDLDQDKWSVHHAAKTLSAMLRRPYPASHLYYLLQRGQLKASKKGARWVINKKDLIDLYNKELETFVIHKYLA